MSISAKTRKMLWGRSANRCNFPECRIELVMDATETDDETIIGEECHIVAQKIDGPRGDSELALEKRDKYNNLILMCSIHHKIIDDQYNSYPIEKLHDFKKSHEKWVKNSLNYDFEKQRIDETYLTYVDEWIKLADIYNWDSWICNMISSGQPSLSIERNENLRILKRWLFNRIWPKKYPELDMAFENFRRVLEDLYNLFNKEVEKWGDDSLITRKFYKIDYYDEEQYSKLHKQFEFHVYLVEDLVVELTRAGNYICDKIRKYILPSFMINEGRLTFTYGPTMNFSFNTHIVEYVDNERIDIPYPGLEKFKIIREFRDFHFSKGADWNDPKFLEFYNSW